MKQKDNKIHNQKVDQLIHSIGLKYGLRDHIVKNIVEAQFKLAKDKIESLDLDGGTNNQNVNFYFKYIGKLYLNKKQNDRKTKHSN